MAHPAPKRPGESALVVGNDETRVPRLIGALDGATLDRDIHLLQFGPRPQLVYNASRVWCWSKLNKKEQHRLTKTSRAVL